MLKNVSKLEHKIGDKVYHLLCDTDSPLVDVKEALFEFVKFIGKIEDDAKAQQKLLENEKNKEDVLNDESSK